MVWLSWTGLVQLRFAMVGNAAHPPLWSIETLLVLVAQGLVFWYVGLYRGIWRFASVPDLVNIVKASLIGLFAIVLSLFIYNRLDQTSRLALVMYPLVLSVMLGAPPAALPLVEGPRPHQQRQVRRARADPRRRPRR